MLAGQVMVGASLSVTVMVNEQVVLLWAPHVAWKLTVVLPIGKMDPLVGPAICRMTAAPFAVVIIGWGNVTTAPHSPVLLEVSRFPEQVIVGGGGPRRMGFAEGPSELLFAKLAIWTSWAERSAFRSGVFSSMALPESPENAVVPAFSMVLTRMKAMVAAIKRGGNDICLRVVGIQVRQARPRRVQVCVLIPPLYADKVVGLPTAQHYAYHWCRYLSVAPAL